MRRTLLGLSWLGILCCLFLGCARENSSMVATEEAFLPALYKKTMCFGPCPAFTFEVAGTGAATLSIDRPLRNGPLSKLNPGVYRAQMFDASAWNARLQAAADEVQYNSLDSLYDNQRITDLPATITEWAGKSVTNRYNGPDLTPFYAAFDEAMAALKWLPNETK
tara:strand:+ start:823 stop:1317 length:495 start_codon:yes stop_codon:yes gene_type:complete